MRHTTARAAFGMTSRGFSVSPAATPMSSIDAYAKMTPDISMNIGDTPFGKKPLSVMLCRPAVAC